MTKIGQTLQVGSIINQHLITLRLFVPFTVARLAGGGGGSPQSHNIYIG